MTKPNEVEIIKLSYPDNMRLRPGMWGCDGTNANLLFRELVDNSVDLTLKFKLSINIKSVINQKEWNFLSDDGIGLPVYLDKDFPEEDQPVLIDMMRRVNAGSNFHKTEYSTGMNGCGSRITQALSTDFIIVTNAGKKDKDTLPQFMKDQVDSKPFYCYYAKKGVLEETKMLSIDEVKGWLTDLGVEWTSISSSMIDLSLIHI